LRSRDHALLMRCVAIFVADNCRKPRSGILGMEAPKPAIRPTQPWILFLFCS